MDLTWICPIPQAVRIGARSLLASPLRLRDLARLQAFARDAVPCPLDAARRAIHDAAEGSEARRRLLRDAYRACQKWPARLGTEDGRKILDTDEGLRFWLEVALRGDNPGLTSEDLDELRDTITVSQHCTLVRIAYGSSPLDELTRLISPDSFPEPTKPSEPTNWGKLAAWVIEETGWTFDQFGDLRLTQLAAWESDGKAGSGTVEPPPGMSRFAFARRQRHFFGPDRDEEVAS